QIDDLAALLTGRKLVKRPKATRKSSQVEAERPPAKPARAPAPVADKAAAAEPSKPEPVLDLSDYLPPPPQAPRKRPRPLSPARARGRKKRPTSQPGTLRLAAALMALLAASMWYVEKRTDIDFLGYAISSPR